MHAIWMENRERDARELRDQEEVSNLLTAWSHDNGRNEGELLRRMESNRMLSKFSNNMSERGTPRAIVEPAYVCKPRRAMASKQEVSSLPIIVKKGSVNGMHYKNPLPPNFQNGQKGSNNDEESTEGEQPEVNEPEHTGSFEQPEKNIIDSSDPRRSSKEKSGEKTARGTLVPVVKAESPLMKRHLSTVSTKSTNNTSVTTRKEVVISLKKVTPIHSSFEIFNLFL